MLWMRWLEMLSQCAMLRGLNTPIKLAGGSIQSHVLSWSLVCCPLSHSRAILRGVRGWMPPNAAPPPPPSHLSAQTQCGQMEIIHQGWFQSPSTHLNSSHPSPCLLLQLSPNIPRYKTISPGYWIKSSVEKFWHCDDGACWCFVMERVQRLRAGLLGWAGLGWAMGLAGWGEVGQFLDLLLLPSTSCLIAARPSW